MTARAHRSSYSTVETSEITVQYCSILLATSLAQHEEIGDKAWSCLLSTGVSSSKGKNSSTMQSASFGRAAAVLRYCRITQTPSGEVMDTADHMLRHTIYPRGIDQSEQEQLISPRSRTLVPLMTCMELRSCCHRQRSSNHKTKPGYPDSGRSPL